VLDAGVSRSAAIATTSTGSVLAPALSAACTNCGGGPVGRFCAACGQRHVTPRDYTARSFLHEMLGEMISIDGRLWLTLWTLVRHPGKLAREYFDGRGARYMRPLNLFLLLNLVFFLVQPHTGLLQWHLKGYLRGIPSAQVRVDQTRAARAEERERARVAQGAGPGAAPAPLRLESMELFESEFEATIQSLKKSMLLVAIPLFALALGACYGTKRRLAEHLIFSTHFYAFSVFTLTVLIPLTFMAMTGWLRLLRAPGVAYQALSGEGALVVVLFGILGGHLFFGLRRMYGDSRPAALVRAVALFAAHQGIVIVFASTMFRVTLWAM
jgi:hypothetical protein